eukprot:6209275-Pleurochrysis_carterae.AAC.1
MEYGRLPQKSSTQPSGFGLAGCARHRKRLESQLEASGVTAGGVWSHSWLEKLLVAVKRLVTVKRLEG